MASAKQKQLAKELAVLQVVSLNILSLLHDPGVILSSKQWGKMVQNREI